MILGEVAAIMVRIASVGKFLDQPLLTAKINKHMPEILALGSTAFIINDAYKSKAEEKKKRIVKNSLILGSTCISALAAPKIATTLTKRKGTFSYEQIVEDNRNIINSYLSSNKVEKATKNIVTKARTKVLSLKEVDKLNQPKNKSITEQLIPSPQNINAKDIFKEIGWLSIYGAIPVVGGIAGGVAADRVTEKDWKKRVPNKIKEGVYQYLANIFLCNIGAGIALGILEKASIKSKSARCVGMVAGILATGVIGGSVIANYIGNHIINPIMSKDKKKETRTPEILDLTLHTDDIATVSLLSGLKWIEPSLPILYSISGYRAGIGYRNDKHNTDETKT